MNTKKVVLTLLVVFLGFWMFNDPHGFAVSAKSLSAGILGGADRVLPGADPLLRRAELR